jgi:Short C-terminal domain
LWRRWCIEEISRGGFSSGAGDIGIGSGMIYGSGRAHHVLVPYVDENGIPQASRFDLSSYKGEAIRKLAAELYQQVVIEKRESTKYLSKADKQPLNQEPVSSPNIDDSLKVLKLRFAKGEITKEQYEEMRKILE